MIELTLEQAYRTDGQLKHWAYNALDVTGTREVWDTLSPRLDAATERTYRFEQAQQAPALDMTIRGVLVDEKALAAEASKVARELVAHDKAMNKGEPLATIWDRTEKNTGFCEADPTKHHKWPRGVPDDDPGKVCERCGAKRLKRKPFNSGSYPDKMHLFYDLLGVTPMKNKKKKVAVDDDILLRIGAKYPQHWKLTDDIRTAQDLKKQLGWLKAKRRPDGRFTASFNPGAAWTGRFSSSKDPMHFGGNLQNVSEKHRHVFIADPGFEMCYADLKTAESNAVAHMAGDEKYILAHKKGDPHTFVSALIWPDLDWPEGNPVEWDLPTLKIAKKYAKSHNPDWDQAEGHEYRFQAKRIQHGSNYLLTPQGIAMLAHIPKKAADEAQSRYFGEFIYIQPWQNWTKAKASAVEPIINPVGRRVVLFGRPNDPHTHKQAVAFAPQSLVADLINLALWRVWRYGDGLIQLLAQVHDAILCQWRAEDRDAAIAFLKDAMTIPVHITDYRGTTRTLVIDVELAVGKNWGHKSPTNPNGIEEL